MVSLLCVALHGRSYVPLTSHFLSVALSFSIAELYHSMCACVFLLDPLYNSTTRCTYVFLLDPLDYTIPIDV